MEPEWSDKRDKTGLAAWPGLGVVGAGAFFCVGIIPSLAVWALGWVE